MKAAEYLALGIDYTAEVLTFLVVEGGDKGRFYMTFADFEKLLAAQGDVCAPSRRCPSRPAASRPGHLRHLHRHVDRHVPTGDRMSFTWFAPSRCSLKSKSRGRYTRFHWHAARRAGNGDCFDDHRHRGRSQLVVSRQPDQLA
ncbi:gp32 domain protein [Mycobacterium xenopi 3993]|nr:gp32 domain protein [Mycobacterium xenopi 3993]